MPLLNEMYDDNNDRRCNTNNTYSASETSTGKGKMLCLLQIYLF